MVKISVKYGTTFKKGKDFHRIDLTIRKKIGNENLMEMAFKEMFDRLKNETLRLKEKVLKDARI